MLLRGSIGVMVDNINFAFAFFKSRVYNTDPKCHQKVAFRISLSGKLSYRQRFLLVDARKISRNTKIPFVQGSQ